MHFLRTAKYPGPMIFPFPPSPPHQYPGTDRKANDLFPTPPSFLLAWNDDTLREIGFAGQTPVHQEDM